MILDVGIGEKRKGNKILFDQSVKSNSYINIWKSVIGLTYVHLDQWVGRHFFNYTFWALFATSSRTWSAGKLYVLYKPFRSFLPTFMPERTQEQLGIFKIPTNKERFVRAPRAFIILVSRQF